MGRTIGPYTFEYDWQRVALYALGSGATAEELDLLLESRGPRVLPTFSVVPAYEPLFASLQKLGGNMMTLVHGGQRCEIERPIPPSGRLTSTATVRALYDKGRGALAIVDTDTTTADGTRLFRTEWQIFYRGEGGFGGERGPEAPAHAPPEGKAADHRIEATTTPTQALLYRLGSNDLNPIHADPEVAKKVGFGRPILHGLCTFSFAGRAAIQALCGGDPQKLRSIEGRFTKPVYPGDTLITELWTLGPGEAVFSTAAIGRASAKGDGASGARPPSRAEGEGELPGTAAIGRASAKGDGASGARPPSRAEGEGELPGPAAIGRAGKETVLSAGRVTFDR